MSNCPTCKESIFSQTKSLIGETQCTQPCPPEITCEDFIASNCVYYSGPTLSCPSGSVSINYSDTITVALNKLYQLICQNSTSNTIKITELDTCYGYLSSKITSSSLDITIANQGACEKLNIEEKCWGPWTELTNANSGLSSKWEWAGGNYEKPAVSSIKGCSVKLAGAIKLKTLQSITSTTVIIGTLPVGKTPVKDRVFSANILTSFAAPYNVLPCVITIVASTGKITLGHPWSTTTLTGITVFLDGIEFETTTII